MKLFRKKLAFMGVEPLQPFQKNHSTILFIKRLLIFIVLITYVIFLTVFIGYEAKTIDEYADAIYLSATSTSFLLNFSIILWANDSLFKLIDDFENLIRMRKIFNYSLTLKYK